MSIAFSSAQKKLLRKFKIQAVYLFGSRALKTETALADYDYAILVDKKGHSKGDSLYFQLYELLSKISPRTLKNDIIDIVFLRDIGLELRQHVIRYGKVIFDGAPKARAHFESETVLLYCDYRPILDQFDRNILESL